MNSPVLLSRLSAKDAMVEVVAWVLVALVTWAWVWWLMWL